MLPEPVTTPVPPNKVSSVIVPPKVTDVPLIVIGIFTNLINWYFIVIDFLLQLFVLLLYRLLMSLFGVPDTIPLPTCSNEDETCDGPDTIPVPPVSGDWLFTSMFPPLLRI